ncbi:ABC transporter A family member 2 isoform X4 [Beta vulgaris subsp. vulgaris]|uniref:ABC transporter A family member 2 isoform X4 n=1 Tax=Beta vulgaris subsp. vulgaris TaxID=3555 RepID=UPI000900FBAE|nr:ABC transporter A family member 2 isoform X4 [Beta vulgaris subsp. vulgaris]
MELVKGGPLLLQQFKALFFKNVLLSWRHKWATIIQLFSSLIFIFLMFSIQKAIETQFKNTTYYDTVLDPTSIIFPSISPCEDKFFVKLPCFDFVYSGNSSNNVNRIVSSIMANNPGRPIPASKVQSFTTEADVDAWLLSNPMYCSGVLHFMERNETTISYGVQTNSTAVQRRGKYEDPTSKFQIPLQIAAEREIARFLIGDPNFSWTIGFKEFAHPARDPFSAIGTIGPTFFLAVAMFGFVFQLSSLVMEKELKLRLGMSMMGLYDTAYWMSWLAWEGVLVVVSSTFIVLFGKMFQFDFFLHNNTTILFLVFFLFQLNMTVFAFALSAFISQSCSATNIGFYNFIIGIISEIVTTIGFPYNNRFSQTYRVIWSLYPPNLFAKALHTLTKASRIHQDSGMSWSQRTRCAPNDDNCILTMGLWLNLAEDQLFCLLGPNGAGKTTAINCLTGITPITNGDALVQGHSIRNSVGMSRIRKMIGVCPQFDILWDVLTGEEHLNLFANIKGLHCEAISMVVQNSLTEVRLINAAKMRASSYSGGMKRRLSVAIALVGDPRVIILDEPTTGMDPISRRHVWDIIEKAKRGRSIILTTHSMEEADTLSDRIGIMVKGKLRCIGTSIRLKSRFGTGFVAHLTFAENVNGISARGDANYMSSSAAVIQFFKHRLGVVPKEENQSFLSFVIPHEKEQLLTKFFEELEERLGEFGIVDIQLGLTSLEEVFLNIEGQAKKEHVPAEGKLY